MAGRDESLSAHVTLLDLGVCRQCTFGNCKQQSNCGSTASVFRSLLETRVGVQNAGKSQLNYMAKRQMVICNRFIYGFTFELSVSRLSCATREHNICETMRHASVCWVPVPSRLILKCAAKLSAFASMIPQTLHNWQMHSQTMESCATSSKTKCEYKNKQTNSFYFYDRLQLLKFYGRFVSFDSESKSNRMASEYLYNVSDKQTARQRQTAKQIEKRNKTKRRKIVKMMFASSEVAIKANVNISIHLQSHRLFRPVRTLFRRWRLCDGDAFRRRWKKCGKRNTVKSNIIRKSEAKSHTGSGIHFLVFEARIILSASFAVFFLRSIFIQVFLRMQNAHIRGVRGFSVLPLFTPLFSCDRFGFLMPKCSKSSVAMI